MRLLYARQSINSAALGRSLPYRWAGRITVGAKHTTVPFLRSENNLAGRALQEEDTRIRPHFVRGHVPTFGTLQTACELDLSHQHRVRITTPSSATAEHGAACARAQAVTCGAVRCSAWLAVAGVVSCSIEVRKACRGDERLRPCSFAY